MKNLLPVLALLFQFSALAQSVPLTFEFEHNGGNGGDADEVMIKNSLLQIGVFLDGAEGKALFSSDLDSRKFLSAVKVIDIRVTEKNIKSCAVNFPDKKLAVFNRGCLDKLRSKGSDLYTLLAHEVLNIMGVELADSLSNRIGAAGPLISARSKDVLYSSHCKLAVNRDNLEGWDLSKTDESILKIKGYSLLYVGQKREGEEFHELNFSLLDSKHDRFKVENGEAIFEDGDKIKIESSFVNNKYNGLIGIHLDNYSAYIPSPMKKHKIEPKGFWKQSLVEGMMKLPSCVKY